MALIRAKKALDHCGQVTIFFAMVTIAIIAFLAFIINVGLFVKAKINFQNAVDAAAWSGAAVQARQLTNIAYMNWELHNTYKEWMFKYYVLGQTSLNHTHVNNPKFDTFNTPNMNFRARIFNGNTDKWDPYNVPTVCIHPDGNNVNICEIYDVPGIPRFPPMGIPGMDDEYTAFIDSISRQKGRDCALRSETNFSTLLQWVYGVKGSGHVIPNAPQIAANRMGAWPEALEIALRIRNLEMIVNRPPISGGICINGDICSTSLDALNRDATDLPLNERPIKAFLAAYKALGSKKYMGRHSELKRNLVLYEVAADESQVDFSSGETLSNFLIPNISPNSEIPNPRLKYYLDLKIVPINFVNFFTAFVSDTGNYEDIHTDAECKGSKSALPVPGYIFGFVKNPEILTYYAVKAETKYIGLMFPFTDTEGITMKAYAAAKPFGGRIGPQTFDIVSDSENASVTARGDQGDQFQSAPFISGFDVTGLSSFQSGYPIPLAHDFWVATAGQVIGGIPSAGNPAYFGVPNMLYEYIPSNMSTQAQPDADKIQILKNAGSYSDAYNNVTPAIGLYNKEQFKEFARSFQPFVDHPTADGVAKSIELARRPTHWDALNYLIPTMSENDQGDNFDTLHPIVKKTTSPYGSNIYYYYIYAPLFHENALYKNAAGVKSVLDDYIHANRKAIETFLLAYYDVAATIRSKGVTYEAAAQQIHDGTTALEPTCASIAGKFKIFFTGAASGGSTCGIHSLPEIVTKYWNDQATGHASFQIFYRGIYAIPDADAATSPLSNSQLMTAYAPGKNHYGDGTSSYTLPYTGTTFTARRNAYSTKFVAIGRLMDSNPIYSPYIGGQFPTIHDYSDTQNITRSLPKNIQFLNSIPATELSDFSVLDH